MHEQSIMNREMHQSQLLTLRIFGSTVITSDHLLRGRFYLYRPKRYPSKSVRQISTQKQNGTLTSMVGSFRFLRLQMGQWSMSLRSSCNLHASMEEEKDSICGHTSRLQWTWVLICWQQSTNWRCKLLINCSQGNLERLITSSFWILRKIRHWRPFCHHLSHGSNNRWMVLSISVGPKSQWWLISIALSTLRGYVTSRIHSGMIDGLPWR